MPILTESFLPKAITMFGIVLVLCIIHSTSPYQEGDSLFAYAHFFGENITRDGYQVIFQPFPFAPMAGDNTTLNFSILDEENLNIHNIFSALIIQDKKTNETIAQIPYRQYMYSDITFPYRFSNNYEYLITLETRIIGDPKFQTQPLTASFDLIVGDQTSEYFKMIMIYFVTPVCAAIIGALLIYELQWKRKKARIKKGKRNTTG
jgi:hypothetical protein